MKNEKLENEIKSTVNEAHRFLEKMAYVIDKVFD